MRACLPWRSEIWLTGRLQGRYHQILCQHHHHFTTLLPATARPAKPEEVDSYLHRMQERGWDASNTVAKLLRNNARFSLEVRDVSRVEGLLSDAAMIGALMWTTDPQTHLWWPVEVLDPFNMPAGRD